LSVSQTIRNQLEHVFLASTESRLAPALIRSSGDRLNLSVGAIRGIVLDGDQSSRFDRLSIQQRRLEAQFSRQQWLK
jgi:hypothetical protein